MSINVFNHPILRVWNIFFYFKLFGRLLKFCFEIITCMQKFDGWSYHYFPTFENCCHFWKYAGLRCKSQNALIWSWSFNQNRILNDNGSSRAYKWFFFESYQYLWKFTKMLLLWINFTATGWKVFLIFTSYLLTFEIYPCQKGLTITGREFEHRESPLILPTY